MIQYKLRNLFHSWSVFALAAGMWLGGLPLFFVETISLNTLLPFLITGGCLIVLAYKAYPWLAVCFFAACMSLLWQSSWGLHQLEHRLPKSEERVELVSEGVICSIPSIDTQYASFEFCPFENKFGLRKIKVGWYWYNEGDKPNWMLKEGQYWQLSLSLKTPYAQLNSSGFDTEKWALINGIDAFAYVKAKQKDHNRMINDAISFKQKVVNRYTNIIAKSDFYSWHLALASGDKREFSKQESQLFKQTGTAHLVVISGLHIGLVFAAAFWSSLMIWRLSNRLCLIIPAVYVAVVFGLLLSTVFAWFVGFSIPTQRALIAIALFSCLKLSGRAHTASYSIAWVIIVLTLLQPLQALTQGYWLSMSAILIIFTLLLDDNDSRHKWIKAQILLALLMSAVSALMFGLLSMNAVFSNLLAIPTISFIVLPLDFLLLLISLFHETTGMVSQSILALNDFVLIWLTAFLLIVNESLPAIFLSDIEAFILLVLFVGSAIAVKFRFYQLIIWLLSSVVITWLVYLSTQSRKQIEVIFFDIGQGQSVAVKVDNSWWLYDLGFYNQHSDQTSNVVVPYLRQNGVDQLEGLIISHKDSDHAGNYLAVIDEFKPKKLIVGEVLNKANGVPCEGKTIFSDSSTSKAVWYFYHFARASKQKSIDNTGKRNDNSCIALLDFHGFKFLFTGDIEKKAERWLIDQSIGPVHVMTVPHHGSLTSSSEEFLDYFSPQLAIVSSGYLNRFKHPRKEVQNRYKELNIEFINVSEVGMTRLITSQNGQKMSVVSQRSEKRRWWHHQSNQ